MTPRSVSPWMLEWPRSAFTPPPGMPMFPSSSWMQAMARMFCDPTECCVQPSAYRLVMVRPGTLVVAMVSQIWTNFSFGMPVTLATMSGV